ncbi:hypothetical protein FIE12Z_2226 [Fusarium flagelliforme]|uniref:Heterokaryon incompatibility domain-containing protein n=1 Tax=Fusarium flagelliforme TaxID=2675880 RepID=A0A395MZS7_9HYPO|nr:hypothetical protein FIE12Z_2226 [Fusarium flagelliforme]
MPVLIYCWGISPQFITTKATLEDRKSKIAITDLPKTHQDAIILTRYLGVRYLWIDSICICQDDYEDWEREAARMLYVYANAYLTVIASKAEDSSVGLFSKLPFREYLEFEYSSSGIDGHVLAHSAPLEECESTLYISLPDEPVSQRGWAFQERVLSHRSLIYTKDQMAFECAKGFRTEDGWISEERYHTITQTGISREMKVEWSNTDRIMYRDEREMLLGSWYSLISLYGTRKLTKASDKLPAMSGLASIWSKLLDDDYVAGHWRSSLVYQLPWNPRDCRRVKEYRAPSWSWASVDGAPTLRIRHSCDTLADILDITIKLNGSNLYGEITEGKLVIRAPMQQLDVSTHNCDHGQPRLSFQGQPILHTPVMDTDLTYEHDFDKLPRDIREEEKRFLQSLGRAELYALILLCGTLPGQKTVFYEALLVAKDKGSEVFTRKGILTLNDGMMGWKPEEQAKDECPTITLV